MSLEDVFGNKAILSKLTGPALFAESVLIRDVGEIPLSVIAACDSEVIFFDYKAYKSSASSSLLKVQDNLIKILAGKNLFMRDKLNLLSLPSSRAKILYFLSSEARKRKSKYFTIDFNISELAQFLNLNRSSLSRELSKLKKKASLIITIRPSAFYNFIFFFNFKILINKLFFVLMGYSCTGCCSYGCHQVVGKSSHSFYFFLFI